MDRTFRLDRIYFRYIRGTHLDGKVSLETLADRLESMGLIRILRDRQRYIELEYIPRSKVIEALKGDTI